MGAEFYISDSVIDWKPRLGALCVAISINLVFTKIFRMMWYEGRAQQSSAEHLPSISSANTVLASSSPAPASLGLGWRGIITTNKYQRWRLELKQNVTPASVGPPSIKLTEKMRTRRLLTSQIFSFLYVLRL